MIDGQPKAGIRFRLKQGVLPWWFVLLYPGKQRQIQAWLDHCAQEVWRVRHGQEPWFK